MKPELILIVLFLGCAAPAKNTKKPPFCAIPLTMVLTEEDVANELCYTFFTPVQDETFEPLDKKEDGVMGCAGLRSKTLIAEYDEDTVMHEVRHFVEKYCPWLKEIR